MSGASATLRHPSWLTGLLPLVVLAAAIAAFVGFGAPGLGERNGVPVEELAVEKTTLRPGTIEIAVRNDGPDPVRISQALVNDSFAPFEQSRASIGRLTSGEVKIDYPWVEGEAYAVTLLTSTGGTVDATIDVAAETPGTDLGFLGLMGLIGLYVGVIPVAIGMLWLPWIRTIDPRYVQFLLAVTLGLLAFLGIDALLEGTEFAGQGSQAFGGAALVMSRRPRRSADRLSMRPSTSRSSSSGPPTTAASRRSRETSSPATAAIRTTPGTWPCRRSPTGSRVRRWHPKSWASDGVRRVA